MRKPDFSHHARAKPAEALVFRAASRYGPAYEGVIRTHMAVGMKREAEMRQKNGIEALIRGALRRLCEHEGGKGKWAYTKEHSLDVALFSYIMAREAIASEAPGASSLNAELCFVGGLVHDVGKTFLPMALVVKELGVDFGLVTLFKGERLNDTEIGVLRDEHLSAGSRYVRLFGYDTDTRVILDVVGLHHVMYDGKDTGVPSYPALLKGMSLPLHARIAKVADFLSAVQPRHYRADNWVSGMGDAVAYGIAVARREIDPVGFSCFLSGIYRTTPGEALSLIERLGCPGEGRELNFKRVKGHVTRVIMADEQFLKIVGADDREKIERYTREAKACARKHGIEMGEEMELSIHQ